MRDSQSLGDLFRKLAAEGLDLARSELALARAEAAAATKYYVAGFVICAACFALAIATVVILAQTAAIALQPYFSGPAMASLVAGLAMAIFTALLAWLGVKFLTRKFRPVGTISKWLTGQINAS